LSNFNTAQLRNQQARWAHNNDLMALSLASAQVPRDKQFTWRHNTYSHCSLRLLQNNYR